MRIRQPPPPVLDTKFTFAPCVISPGYSAGKLVVDVVTLRPRTRFAGERVPDAAALAACLHVSRFEVMEPTLEEIFIENVRASFGDAESGGKVDA